MVLGRDRWGSNVTDFYCRLAESGVGLVRESVSGKGSGWGKEPDGYRNDMVIRARLATSLLETFSIHVCIIQLAKSYSLD